MNSRRESHRHGDSNYGFEYKRMVDSRADNVDPRLGLQDASLSHSRPEISKEQT